MMMAQDPKKLAVTILASKGKGKSLPEPKVEAETESDAGADESGLEAAAQELLSAIDMKDPKALADAFQAMTDICDSADYDDQADEASE